MKSIQSFKTPFLTLFILFMTACESNSTSEPEIPEPPFEAVNISFEGVDVQLNDTSFTVDGFTFRSESAQTTPSNFDNQGVDLTPGLIELELEGIIGISQITISMFNNSDPTISLLNNGELVRETNDDLEGGVINAVIDVEGLTFDALRIFSFEATILSITLE